jgi:hypothetical protein
LVESYGTWLLFQRLDDASKDSDIPKNVPFAFAINTRNTERQPCRRVPRLRLPAQPVIAVCAKGRVGKGGCPTGGSPGTARPEVRAYVSGCPAPAGHGTS